MTKNATHNKCAEYEKTINKALVLGLAIVSLSGCVTSSSYDASQTPGMSDPIEEINRKVFAFNKAVDDILINPVLDAYRFVVPQAARTGINNALTNLQSPVYFANNVLQADIEGAGKVLFSAIVNTFVGFGGLLDVAGYEGYETDKEDFGQTLAVWGIKHGPYIVVPVLGPTTARDGAGYIVDTFADPVYWYSKNVDEKYIRYNKMAAQYFNTRNSLKDGLEDLERNSIDYYASVRSSYYQARKKRIDDNNDETTANVMDFPEYDDY